MIRRPLRSRREFIAQALQFLGFAMAAPFICLGIGVVGYHHFAGLDWVDTLLNAAMILTGMGPVDPMSTYVAKLFASAYAIFSGAVFHALTALVLYPFVHRMMHVLHVQTRGGDGG